MKNLLLLFAFGTLLTAASYGQSITSDSQAKLLSVPKIKYTDEAKQVGVSGRLLVMATVAENGQVTSAEFMDGPGSICKSVTVPIVVELRQAAVDAIRKARFSPAVEDGRRVVSKAILTIDFSDPQRKTKAGKVTKLMVVGDADIENQRAAGGVLNGKAISLPRPVYPAAARAVRAAGSVQVQVLLLEDGTVWSAEAVSGHPLLQASSVNAACGARFSPILLEGRPVRVSGIITYNFLP
jgi:TonB family protein